MSDPLARLTQLEGVSSAYAAARDGFDALLRDRGLRKTAPELTTRSLLLGAQASAELDGVPEEDVARVALELLSLVSTLNSAPLQVIARLHALAAKGAEPDDELGRPVRGGDRLVALGELLRLPTSAPALLVAAVAHAEVVSVAPFATRNGVVARALERLVLVQRGVDPTSLTVPEAGHLALRAAYESNLRGYRDGGAAGVHSWLLYAAEAFTSGANASPLNA